MVHHRIALGRRHTHGAFPNLGTMKFLKALLLMLWVLFSTLAFLPTDNPSYALDVPGGFEGFQFVPPYNTKNPFTKEQLQRVDEGFRVFTTETFDGNGRTCSTCHIPEKNFNITAADIQSLPAEEREKVLASGNPDLENKEIVEVLALFNINQGFGEGSEGNVDEPEGPFRASMSIGGLGFTTLNRYVCRPGQTTPAGTPCTPGVGGLPGNNLIVDDGVRDIMLGWAGDGALIAMFPYDETNPDAEPQDCEEAINMFAADLTNLEKALMTFSLAAVKTHFPITQNRVPGVDFRCPSIEELIDLAMFQKWLGRRFEIDIRKLDFTAALADEGRNIFSSKTASCVACHVNAGASDTQGRVKNFPFPFLPEADFNNNRDEPLEIIGANKASRSGIAFFEPELDDFVSAKIANQNEVPPFAPFNAFDEGDGVNRSGGEFGFNVQSIIESVRKSQFFHNNAIVGTIEDAIGHYFTDKFDNSQGGGAIKAAFRGGLSGQDALSALGGNGAIDKMGFFLRALSSIYSIADCERYIDEMINRLDYGLPLDLPHDNCQIAINDVQKVLVGARINPNPYANIPSQLTAVSTLLRRAAAIGSTNGTLFIRSSAVRSSKAMLVTASARLKAIRKTIATTPELP